MISTQTVNNFNLANKIGQSGEAMVAELFRNLKYEVAYNTNPNDLSTHDLIIQKNDYKSTVEVKTITDKSFRKIIIEYWSHNKHRGIAITTADFWAFVFMKQFTNPTIVFVKTELLKYEYNYLMRKLKSDDCENIAHTPAFLSHEQNAGDGKSKCIILEPMMLDLNSIYIYRDNIYTKITR